MWDLSYLVGSSLFSMVTFHVVRKPNLSILVFDIGIIQVTKNVLCAIFVFQWGSMHVSNNVSYGEDNMLRGVRRICDFGWTR